jgi:uncharacterized protein (TIGR02099 family)
MIRTFYNFCWYAVGAVILLAAVLITVVRLMLPDIGSYRDDIQAWVSHYMGYPVVIQSLHADWRGWSPQLYLNDVTLLNQAGDRAIAEFDNAYISFNPLRSLYHRQLIPESLVISGVRLQLMRLEDGSLLAVYPGQPPEMYDEFLTNDELTRWLLAQPIVELRNARIDWFEQQHVQRPVNLQNANLLLRTDADRTQITGDADLARQLGDRIEFSLDVEGDLLSSDWRGMIYIRGEQLLPAGWPAYSQWQDVEIGAGRSDLEIWSEWENAALKNMSGTLSVSDLLLLGNNHSNLVHSANGSFMLERDESHNSWHLYSNIQELSTHNGVWPASRIEIMSQHGTLNGYASFLRIEDILPLIIPAGELAGRPAIMPDDMTIYGDMETVQFSVLTDMNSWRMSADFRNTRILSPNENPSIAGLAGKADIRSDGGNISLNSRAIQFRYPELFATTFTGISADGAISWIQSDEAILFRTAELNLGLSDLRVQLSGNMNIDPENRIYVDMIARTRNGDEIDTLKQLTPLTASDDLRNWIEHALVGGRLEYADLVLRGDIDRFPFKQQEGQLKVHARFDDVTLDYHKNWPPIYHLEADLTLSRNQLSATIPTGRMYEARIHDTTALIETVFDPDSVLSVTGSVDGHARDALKFLNESPLRDDKQIHRVRDLAADGEIALMLDMQIPLNPDPNKISGRLELLGNQITSPDPELELADVTGFVNFTSTSIDSEQLRGSFHGETVNLSIHRESDSPDEATIMRMSGSADSRVAAEIAMDYIPVDRQHMDTMLDRLSGRTSWEVEIHTYPEQQHIDSIAVTSDLRGIFIDLPDPLGKPADEIRPFKLTLSTNGTSEVLNHLQLNYGDALQAISADGHVSLYFGAEQPAVPDKSAQLAILGTTPTLQLDAWFRLFAENRDLFGDVQQVLSGREALKVDLQINDMTMYGQAFPDSHIVFAQEQGDWLLSATGTNMIGTISIPASLEKTTVSARFDKLHLQSLNSEKHSPDIDPRTLPAFSIEVEDFIYGKAALGNLYLEARKTPNGLLINEFSTRTPGLAVDGRGDWHAVNNEIVSDFELELEAERFADMLHAFGYSVIAIEDGETTIEVAANWPGAPTDFSLAGINGSLSLDIRKGQFLDIDPKAGRLFGLLSIQALPRRLALDFADLFRKGLAFDQISGTFEIMDGHAYTNDLLMEGVASKVAISGRTGLVDQDYDQIVTVTPHISDSLPIASALFGPAGIGIGAIILLAGQVFEAIPDQIDKLLSFQYTMTGSWQEPVVEPYQPRETDTKIQELGQIN